MKPHAPVLALLAVLSLPLERIALATDGLALNRFQPAPAGDRFFGVPSAYVAGDFTLHAALLADYAYKPLLLRRPPAEQQSFLTYQTVVHANLTLALHKRLLFNLEVPAVSIQSGHTSEPTHLVDFGDVRLGARYRLFGKDGTPFQLGLGGYLWLPSATGATVGDGKVRGMPYVSASGLFGALLYSAVLGGEFRASQLYENVVWQGSSLDWGLGLAYLLDERRRLQLGLEATASLVLSNPSSRNFNAELLFEGRYRFFDRFEAGAAVGPGLTEGVGTPTVRALAILAYVPVAELSPPWQPTSFNDRSGEGLVARSQVLSRDVEPVRVDEPRAGNDAGSAPRGQRFPAGRNTVPVARIVADQIEVSDPGLVFASGSATLDARGEWQVHAVADLLIAHPEIRKVELRGQADLHGTLDGNERLGERRAESVRRALIHHSVDGARLLTTSDGASAPAAPSTTSDGLSRNRRVVIHIVERAPAPN